jgi:hypothetical protein
MSSHFAGGSSGVRSAVNALRNALNEEGQLKQSAPNENAHKKRHNSYHESNESLSGGILKAHDHVRDDANAAAENPNDVKNLHEAAHELVLEREVNETRKEVLVVGHVASWLDFDDEPGFLLGTAIDDGCQGSLWRRERAGTQVKGTGKLSANIERSAVCRYPFAVNRRKKKGSQGFLPTSVGSSLRGNGVFPLALRQEEW